MPVKLIVLPSTTWSSSENTDSAITRIQNTWKVWKDWKVIFIRYPDWAYSWPRINYQWSSLYLLVGRWASNIHMGQESTTEVCHYLFCHWILNRIVSMTVPSGQPSTCAIEGLISFYAVCLFSRSSGELCKVQFNHWFPPAVPYAHVCFLKNLNNAQESHG